MSDLSPEREIELYERLERLKQALAGVVQDGSPESYEQTAVTGWYRGWHDGFDAAEGIARQANIEHRAVVKELLDLNKRAVDLASQHTRSAVFWVVCSSVLLATLGIWWWRS